MKIDKGQISGTTFMFTVACFIQASSLLTSFLAAVTMQDSWIAVLIGSLLCLPIIWLYRCLMTMFPEQDFMEVLQLVYGPVLGKILGAAYVWFFCTLAAINLVDLGDFTKLTLMEETPLVVLITMCALVAAIAVRNGVKLVTRYGTLFAVIALIILVLSVLLVLNQANAENFLPILNLPLEKYVQGTHIILTIPFGEIVVFLMITPNTKLTPRERTKYLFWGFAMGAGTMLFIIMRDIAVLGNTLDMFTLPNLVTLRLVNLGPALSRMEILFAIVLIMLLFFKITVLYYAFLLAFAQLFKMKHWRHLVLAGGALIIAYGLTLYPCPVEHASSGQEIVPLLWTPFEILIPLLTLIIAHMRGLAPKKKKKKRAA